MGVIIPILVTTLVVLLYCAWYGWYYFNETLLKAFEQMLYEYDSYTRCNYYEMGKSGFFTVGWDRFCCVIEDHYPTPRGTQDAIIAVILEMVCVLAAFLLPYLWHWILAQTGDGYKPARSVALQRSFSGLGAVHVPKRTSDNLHAIAAHNRLVGSALCKSFASSCGRKPYVVQYANRDAGPGVEGEMHPYFDSDCKTEHIVPFWKRFLRWITFGKCFGPDPDKHVEVMVDTDYYVDMKQRLQHFMPRVLYTFIPDTHQPPKSEEIQWWFDGDELVTECPGSNGYRHKLWDWNKDLISVTRFHTTEFCCYMMMMFAIIVATETFIGSWWQIWLPIAVFLTSSWACGHYVRYVYKIQRKQVAANRYVVAILPYAVRNGLNWGIGTELERFRVSAEGDKYWVIRSLRGGAYEYLVGTKDMGLKATLPADAFETLKLKAASDAKVQSYAVASVLKQYSLPEDRAELLLGFLKSMQDVVAPTVHPAPRVISYQFPDKNGNFDLSAPPSMHDFMSPLVGGGFAPSRTGGNAENAAATRINLPQERVRVFETTPEQLKYIDEFRELWLKNYPKAQNLSLYDSEQVLDSIKVSGKRSIVARLLDWVETTIPLGMTIVGFLKREGYVSPNNPRVISPMDRKEYIQNAEVWMPISKAVTGMSWYAGGLTPKEIAYRVADYCTRWFRKTGKCYEVDGSRWDGHQGPLRKSFDEKFYPHLFVEEDRERVSLVIMNQHERKVIIVHHPNRPVYEAASAVGGTQQPSGFFSTSVGNGTFARFLVYCGARAAGMSPDVAWADESFHLGDDIISESNNWSHIARMTGMKFTGAECDANTGITFLSRHFGPDVMFGDPTSTCSPCRSLQKFHMSVDRCATHDDKVAKLLAKCCAYYLTDSKTPIIGAYCERAMELTGTVLSTTPAITPDWSYFATFAQSDQFPQTRQDWMLKEMSEELRVDVDTIIEYEKTIRACTTIEQLMSMKPIVTIDPVPKQTAEVAGEIIIPPSNNLPAPGHAKVANRWHAFVRSITESLPALTEDRRSLPSKFIYCGNWTQSPIYLEGMVEHLLRGRKDLNLQEIIFADPANISQPDSDCVKLLGKLREQSKKVQIHICDRISNKDLAKMARDHRIYYFDDTSIWEHPPWNLDTWNLKFTWMLCVFTRLHDSSSELPPSCVGSAEKMQFIKDVKSRPRVDAYSVKLPVSYNGDTFGSVPYPGYSLLYNPRNIEGLPIDKNGNKVRLQCMASPSYGKSTAEWTAVLATAYNFEHMPNLKPNEWQASYPIPTGATKSAKKTEAKPKVESNKKTPKDKKRDKSPFNTKGARDGKPKREKTQPKTNGAQDQRDKKTHSTNGTPAEKRDKTKSKTNGAREQRDKKNNSTNGTQTDKRDKTKSKSNGAHPRRDKNNNTNGTQTDTASSSKRRKNTSPDRNEPTKAPVVNEKAEAEEETAERQLEPMNPSIRGSPPTTPRSDSSDTDSGPSSAATGSELEQRPPIQN